MNINEIIIRFSVFLNSTFAELLKVSKVIEKEDVFYAEKLESGYLQYIWETLVELAVCDENEGLVPYGDGADFFDLSSRVLFQSKVAVKQIEVVVNNSIDYISKSRVLNSKLEFNKLVNFKQGVYSSEAPFDYVRCENEEGDVFIFKLSEVDFVLVDL